MSLILSLARPSDVGLEVPLIAFLTPDISELGYAFPDYVCVCSFNLSFPSARIGLAYAFCGKSNLPTKGIYIKITDLGLR